MAKRQTAGKAAPAAAATAEQQGSLPAGVSQEAAAAAAALDNGQQAAVVIASPGTPGADAIAPGADLTLQPTESAAAETAATQGLELPGATQGQDVHLGLSAGGDAPVPGAASQLMAGTGVSELGDEIQGLFVRSVPESFRRCGYRFTREGFGIALSALTDDGIDALCSDPNLVVEHCTFSDKDLG